MEAFKNGEYRFCFVGKWYKQQEFNKIKQKAKPEI